MNGIIHGTRDSTIKFPNQIVCSHPAEFDLNALANITEEDIVVGVVKYIERLFNIVKPQKLFYMAVDGVAPRAKMNQQRQRRFRAARDAEDALQLLRERGEKIPQNEPFDSNCITPGTEFMSRLSDHLKFFIRKKVTEDSLWRNITVIFSGQEVPGEGEHKILEYIRHMKCQPSWEPNLVHCLYGLDADLIMLSLATHEPHFSLLREEG
eukprot:TRINITY_DN11428_c0_g1_i1.p1 TRINITY_DN11428_c0_g1~~TRINITY_DN11428_c0_g1_i1.p1  ORF type:complete len:209 (-),score=26.81 TRINITY_DN11428_c0_g1_i1:193-819(-)